MYQLHGALPAGAKFISSSGLAGVRRGSKGRRRGRKGRRGFGRFGEDAPAAAPAAAPAGGKAGKKKKLLIVGLGALGLGGLLAWLLWPKEAGADPQDAQYDTGGQPAVRPMHGAYSYTIARGDSLTLIAQRQLGDMSLAMWIYDLNRGTIGDNINRITRGDVIQIPTAESVAAAPAGALIDFRQRLDALKRDYRNACAPPIGTGSRDCSANAIIPVSREVSEPTVIEGASMIGVPAAGTARGTGQTTQVTSSFEYAKPF